MNTHFVSTQHREGMAFTADVNGHLVQMDSAPEGDQSGVSPKRLLLAGLAGCTGIDIVSILEKMKVAFTHFRIDVNGTLSKEHPRIYEAVTITYHIKLAKTDEIKMEKAIKLSQEKYCGVSAMFQAFSKIETVINYV